MSVQPVELPLLFYAWRRKAAGNVAPHRHGGCELIYVLEGHCRVESPAGIFEGTPGKLLVIPPEVIHNQIDDPGEDNIFCVFQANPALFAQHWRSLDLGGETRTIRMFLELCDMTEKNDLTGASALLLSFLQRLSAFEQKQSLSTRQHPKLRKALEFLHENLTRPITVRATAEHTGISVSLLRKLFTDYCGTPPLGYLQNLRLARAEELLKNPYLSIAEIAAECGFDSAGYFIRLYRRKHGTSPGKARRGSDHPN